MNNNEILIRLRDALDIKNTDMVEIFKLGGIELTSEEVSMMLIESKDSDHNEDQDIEEKKENLECNNDSLESFLNGFIIFKRGEPDSIPGKSKKPPLAIKNSKSVNNVMLKKLKIALSLTAEDMLDIFEEAGTFVTKGELSPLFRKEGHTHYKYCSDNFAIKFLNGVAIKNQR
ncbi:DUF1456 family protein [Lutibacter sp. B2]|nr:DUF1456 family protein [Lutibacter sp. B2]